MTEQREWDEHQADHAREHRVADETARRLERQVDETAKRIEVGVQAALAAVTETAKVHSEAHNREHLAHERIHAVEKVQVDKAEDQMNKRLEGMNEFRSALQDQSARMITREVFEAYQKEREARLQSAVDRIITLERDGAKQSDIKALDVRVVKAETSSASSEAVEAVRIEARRQRNGFFVAVAVLALGVVINLIVNLLQAPVP